MKKLAALVMVMLCVALTGTVLAVPQHERISTKTMLVDRNNDGKIDGVDVYDQGGKVMQRGYDTNRDMVIDRWEQTDENSGLLIVTGSDSAFELNKTN